MTKNQSDWIFNIGLQIAVAICLGTLAVALITGLTPITAVMRSGVAFAVFLSLGWAAAVVWQVPEPEPEESEETATEENPAGNQEPYHESDGGSAFQPLRPEKAKVPTP